QAGGESVGPAKSPSDGSGNATSLLVGSPIGNRLRWDFLGERYKENTNWRAAGLEARQSRAERVRVNIKYDAGDPGRLDVRAFSAHAAPDSGPGVGAEPAWNDRDRRGWGYDAGWTDTMEDDSSIQVEMKYANSAVAGARGSKAGRDDGQFDDDGG